MYVNSSTVISIYKDTQKIFIKKILMNIISYFC